MDKQLTLALFVPRIFTNNPHDTFSTDYFAFITNLLN
jgi:hypothetical protein